jgi:hypothetical protein
MITFDAHFDGENLRPEAPVALPQNVRLRVTVVESEAAENGGLFAPNVMKQSKDLFGNIEAQFGLIDGPPDWAAELDHYLYGTPKRGDATQD